jgi:hypothetical protein
VWRWRRGERSGAVLGPLALALLGIVCIPPVAVSAEGVVLEAGEESVAGVLTKEAWSESGCTKN